MQHRRMILILLMAVPVSNTWAAGTKRDRGFIQVAPSGRYFQWEDGTPFFPIGQNDWPEAFDLRKRSRADLDAYFRDLRDHKVNVLRLLMDVGEKADVVWVETRPGVFNPAFKAWMDCIVGLAEKHDIYLIIAFYPNIIGGAAGNWRFYPYARSAGGEFEHHHEMITHPKAIAYEEGRFRYFVDNWGASRHIFSWELFNEFWHPTRARSDKETIEAHNRWIDRMGRYIRAYEMERFGRYHLRSVSCGRSEFPEDVPGLKADDTNMFRTPNLDFASYHGYGRQLRGAMNTNNNLDILCGKEIEPAQLILSIRETVGIMLKRSPARPVLCTEDFQFCNPKADSYANPLNPISRMFRGCSDDERYDLFLAANWSFIMSGAAGPTMRYPMGFFEDELHETCRVLADFAADVPWSTFEARPAHDRIATDRQDLICTALSDGRLMIAWLYHNVSFKAREPIRPKVEFLGITNRSSNVTWFDGRTGTILRTDQVQEPSPFSLQAPAFRGHVACIVEPAR